MREIPIFIASSIREFEREREALSGLMDTLNKVHAERGVRLVWNRPETYSRTLTFGGKQLDFDAFIPVSEFFILIIGERVGPYTRHEYRLALDRFRRTGKPKILPCFLDSASAEAKAFRDTIRRSDIGEQFVDTYRSFEDIETQVRYELTDYVVNSAEVGEEEAAADRDMQRIIRKLHLLDGEIDYLEARDPTPETVTRIMSRHAEIARLVRKYRVEPDMMMDYLSFLWRQHLHRAAIEAGHWLEGFYMMEDPGKKQRALLNNGLALCYDEGNQWEEAERHYRKALEIYQELAKENPDSFASYVAITCSNLATLCKNQERMEEAERYCQEALTICRRFGKGKYEFLSIEAMIYNSLAGIRYVSRRFEETWPYIREALSIYRELALWEPARYRQYVAFTCNNMGALLKYTENLDEAEKCLKEARDIWRALAGSNPEAFEPYMVDTYYNFGMLEGKRGHVSAAKQYFEQALSLCEKYPYLVREAQNCRDELSEL